METLKWLASTRNRTPTWVGTKEYRVEEIAGKYITYWGSHDHNLPAMLSEIMFHSPQEAMAFCEGHNMRQQELMQSPRHCMKCAAKIS